MYLFLLFSTPCFSQNDTVNIVLDEITLIEHRNLSAISGTMASGIRIDAKLMETYPKMFGYTDPIQYLQSLPGVSTNNDQSGGLHVQGGESSHSLITVSGAPVYGNLNFIGLFSMFNQEHLPTVDFSTSTRQPFLGAHLALDHADTIPGRLSGTASLGLISGQGTLCAPLSSKTALTLSVRRSFINTIYGNMLEYDGSPMRYGFTDANFTLLHRIDKRNDIDLNLLWNKDNGGTIFGAASIASECTWGNTLASLRWHHRGSKVSSVTSMFVTNYSLQSYLNNGVIYGHMPAHITHTGLNSTLTLPGTFIIEAQANYFDILPQDPYVPSNQAGTASQPLQQSILGSIYLSRLFKAGHSLDFTPHLLLSSYNELGQYHCINADPAITLKYDMFRRGTITLESGLKHQYLTQTGMSNAGLPIEFWVAAGRYFAPQKALFGTLSYDMQFNRSRYALSVQAYAKRLWNQTEYTGFVFDMITRPYRLENNLLICSGYNYGFNFMLAKQAGSITGWLSYSYGQSLRQGDGALFPSLFHSSHERQHELNAVLTYKIGRFDIGGNYILASGNPYTPAKNMYLLTNTLLIYYDDYNSARLPMYMRLDLSATYNLPRKGRLEHSLNLSVFNTTAHKNYTLGYIRIDEEEKTIYYKLAKLIVPVIPSISYSCRF